MTRWRGLRNRLSEEVTELALRRARRAAGGTLIELEYPPSASPLPRYTQPHHRLDRLVGAGRDRYAATLSLVESYAGDLSRIALSDPDQGQPSWHNNFLPGLDGALLYALMRSRAPARYVEIGSGNSTKFVARAKRDGRLRTRITSIDPHPRAEIDQLCDETVRQPLEVSDMRLWENIRSGDMVFMDGSHRVFMNSDVVAFFLDVLPALPSGVLVGVHDVYLPFDYPAEIADRYYSEQYLLAAWLLGGVACEVAFPAYWVFMRMRPLVEELWAASPRFAAIPHHGVAFWVETR